MISTAHLESLKALPMLHISLPRRRTVTGEANERTESKFGDLVSVSCLIAEYWPIVVI